MDFDETTIEQVWEKCLADGSPDPNRIRKDVYGAWIVKERFRNIISEYGWEICILDGDENNKAVSNLAPVQMENFLAKKCVVKSDGVINVRKKSDR